MIDLEKIDNFLALIKSFDKSLQFEIIEVVHTLMEVKKSSFIDY